MAKNALVAYFSASGITAKLAECIAEIANADIFEIKPEVPYEPADLDWTDKEARSTIEMNDETCRPPFVGGVENMDQYDTVFVGFPIWWYVEPRIIDTFLEAYDFSGKTIVPFATSGGSKMGKTVDRMKACAPGAKFLEGAILNKATEEDVDEWIESLEI